MSRGFLELQVTSYKLQVGWHNVGMGGNRALDFFLKHRGKTEHTETTEIFIS